MGCFSNKHTKSYYLCKNKLKRNRQEHHTLENSHSEILAKGDSINIDDTNLSNNSNGLEQNV